MIRKSIEFLLLHAAVILPVVLILALVFFESVRAAARFLLRLIARPLLLIAVLALVYDGTRTLAGGSGLVITSLAEHWQALAPTSLEALRNVASKVLSPAAWDAGAQRLLLLPAWLVIGVLGLMLLWIGRKRQRVNVFVN